MYTVKKIPANDRLIMHITQRLLAPEVKPLLFDDFMGFAETYSLLGHPRTLVFGIFRDGLTYPLGTVFFTGIVPYRNANMYAVIFDAQYRGKKILQKVLDDVKKQLLDTYPLSSIETQVLKDNESSIHLLTKNKFKKLGSRADALVINGEPREVIYFYRILEPCECDE
jgi:RimJ/RimL family protein N-acetyltransferase